MYIKCIHSIDACMRVCIQQMHGHPYIHTYIHTYIRVYQDFLLGSSTNVGAVDMHIHTYPHAYIHT